MFKVYYPEQLHNPERSFLSVTSQLDLSFLLPISSFLFQFFINILYKWSIYYEREESIGGKMDKKKKTGPFVGGKGKN